MTNRVVTLRPTLSRGIRELLKRAYKSNIEQAVDRRKDHTLTFKMFMNLVLKRCSYCGGLPNQVLRSKDCVVYINGIDRSDNALGYILGNCVSCCGRCNTIKSTLDYEVFIQKAIIQAGKICCTTEDMHWRHILEHQKITGNLKKLNLMPIEIVTLEEPTTTGQEIKDIRLKYNKNKVKEQNKLIKDKEDLEAMIFAVNNL